MFLPKMKWPVVASLFWLALFLALTPASAQEEPARVTTAALADLLYHPLYTAPATTLSLNESRVGPRTPGFILRLPVRVGDRIEQGNTLAELDCTTNGTLLKQADAARASAHAQLMLAQRQIKRSQTLRKERNISEEVLNQRQADLETAQAELNQAVAALERAQYDSDQCRITAPFTGIVLERLAAEGEWISPGEPVVRLLDSERLEVSAQIPLHQVDTLVAADTPVLTAGDVRYPLHLRHLLAVVDSRGRNREARLEFIQAQALPGSSGRLQWRSTRPHLPADLLVRRQQLGVMLEENGSARFHPLPDALEGHPAVIDLPGHSRIILQGRHSLSDGDPVQLSEPTPVSR